MAYNREIIVNQAKAWLGNNMADGSHRKIIDIYNAYKPLARGYKVKYTDAWCATFVSAVAIKCGYTAIIPTECGCEQQIKLFQSIGAWVENDAYKPSAGDIIYYDWDDTGAGDTKGWAEHVGIVEKVNNNVITVIEGNCNAQVMRREITVNARYIRGYGVPKYTKATSTTGLKFKVGDYVKVSGKLYNNSNASKATSSVKNHYTKITRVAEGAKHPYNTTGDLGWMDESSVQAATLKSVDAVAKEVIAGKWGNGAARKQKLEAAGYNYSQVQKRVNELCQSC